ncbi:MAG: hypothetical protein ACLR8Y_06720 [Alistipes indistinctus]
MPLEFWYIGTDGHCARHFGSLLHAELHVFPDVENALGNNSKGPVIALVGRDTLQTTISMPSNG